MCWADRRTSCYNGGQAFKVCARDARGVIVTVIADNYFGYCKKEVKTQISYSANLFGNAEEEHSGGALVFPSYNLGQEYTENSVRRRRTPSPRCSSATPSGSQPQPEGHAARPASSRTSCWSPAGAHYSMRDMTVTWPSEDGGAGSIPLRADKVYLSPNGYRVQMAPAAARPDARGT